ncbi:hypothetical protein THTE_3049 [Thermogutta terrifontis]|uniref:Uncharacterized protein n=1 Tax=Thermogutta terrifontis TaxID=1331910 RepID=A0A286RI56_9BACT|nr:hypothetical protein THTE_3049 [Thermogutta terrifontis]
MWQITGRGTIGDKGVAVGHGRLASCPAARIFARIPAVMLF